MYADRVAETSTTTGTGDLTLAGAVTGYRTFDSVFGNATDDTDYAHIDYVIENQADASEWEIGVGHLSATGTFVRDAVVSSSNSNALVSFSAGTKDVVCAPSTRGAVSAPLLTAADAKNFVLGTYEFTASMTEGAVHYVPFEFLGTYSLGFDTAQLRVSSAMTATLRLGIYNSNHQGLPSKLLWETAEQVWSGATSQQNIALPAAWAPPYLGLFFFALGNDDNGGTFLGNFRASGPGNMAQAPRAGGDPSNGYRTGLIQTGGYTAGGNLPTTPAPNGVFSNFPCVVLEGV